MELKDKYLLVLRNPGIQAYLFLFYWRGREREKRRDGEKELTLLCWFLPQMLTRTRLGPMAELEPGT